VRRFVSSAYGKVFWALCVFCVAMAALVLGKIYSKGQFGVNLPWLGPKTATYALVIYRTEYKCKDAVVNTVEVPEVGLDAYLAAVNPEWGKPDSGVSGHQFTRYDPDYCPDHARFRLMCLSGGYVAVYRGKTPDLAFLLKEYRDLPESSLHPRDRDVLTKGLVIEGEPDEVDSVVRKHLEGIEE
jgi:hypothetical protein